MEGYSIYVGLDVHKEQISIAEAVGGSREKAEYLNSIPNDTKSVAKLLSRYKGKRVHFCYEAGPTGYGLYRYLKGHGVDCDVVAPSLIPVKAGDRVKTNRRDAVKLASLSRAGELTAISVPSAEQESVRDLTRAREDAKVAEKKAKLNLGSFLLRHGITYSGKKQWSQAYYSWLKTVSFQITHQQLVFEDYVASVIRCSERVHALEDYMQSLYEGWELKPVCDALMALRGVKLITAMSILAELGDLRRFATPRELMAYLGLVPTESTTGDSVRRGSITKAGNSHVRRLLVESAWSYRLKPRRSKAWVARAKNSPKAIQEISFKAMVRLHKRYWSLGKRNLKPQKVIIAVARELAGFVWAVVQEFYNTKSVVAVPA